MGCGTGVETRHAYNIFTEKPLGNQSIGRPRKYLEYNVVMITF
jgi:hypothetical protein